MSFAESGARRENGYDSNQEMLLRKNSLNRAKFVLFGLKELQRTERV